MRKAICMCKDIEDQNKTMITKSITKTLQNLFYNVHEE